MKNYQSSSLRMTTNSITPPIRTKLYALIFIFTLILGVGNVWGGTITFDFEANGSHRSSGNNSYSSNTYVQNTCTISCSYMDVVSSGSPLSGSYHAVGRVAKNTTNSPVLIIGPINLNNATITGITYNVKGVTAMTMAPTYSTNNSDWPTIEKAFTMSTSKTGKGSSSLNITGSTTFYVKIATTVSSSTTSNRDLNIDDIVITYKSKVTFDANGGSCATTNLTQASATASISLPTPTRDGFICTGWYTASSGGTKRGDAGGSYTPSTPETLYAQWEAVAAYTITEQSNNNTHGTVSLSGSIITATPAHCYEYASAAYTVSPSGKATVSQGTGENINKFTVSNVTDNVTITINFAAKASGRTVNFDAGPVDNPTALTEDCLGDGITLPNVTAAGVCKGWTTFAGWATAAVSDSTTTNVTLYAAGSKFTPSSDGQTLYAVYSKAKGSGRDAGYYITTSLSTGKTYIFGAVKAAASATLANNTTFGAVAFTNTYNSTTGGTWGAKVDLTPSTTGYIAADNASITNACKWVLESISSGNYSFKNGSNYIYLGTSIGSTSYAQCGISTSGGNLYLEDYNSTCKDAFMCHPASSGDNSTNMMLYNTSNGYRMYAPRTYSASMTPYVRFYEYDPGSTTYYCSDPNCCTPLTQVNGAISVNQLNETGGTASWTWKGATTGISKNILKVYNANTDALVKTIDNISASATSQSISGLTPCTSYYATLTTVANTGYCDGEEQGQSDSFTTNGWAVHYTGGDETEGALLSNVTKLSGAASACLNENYVATFQANSGYLLPNTVTVYIAGGEVTAGEDYTWSISDGVGTLTIFTSELSEEIDVRIIAEDAPCTPMSTPSVSVEKSYNGATLSWSAIDHASKYKVYIYNNDDSPLESNENVTATSYSISASLEHLTTYKYRVDAVSENESSYCSSFANENFTTLDYPSVTLYYSENGNLSAGVSQKILTDFELAEPATDPCTKKFRGWSTVTVAETNTPPSMMQPGATYQIPTNANCTIYAVYATVTPGTTTYTLTPAASLNAGTYIIAGYDTGDANGKYYKALTGSVDGGKLVNETTGFSINDSKIVSLPESACEFTFTAVTGGYSIQKSNDDYLGYTSSSSNNTLAFGSYSTLVWNATTLSKTGYPTGGVYLSTNAYKISTNASSGSTTLVRGYSSNTYNPIYLFKKSTGSPTYSAYTTTCTGQVATPTFEGVTADEDCDVVKSVTINCTTENATIHYTTDGSAPTTSSPTYSSAITLGGGAHTIKAIAVKDGMDNSEVASISYTLPYSTIASFIAAAPNTARKLIVTDAVVLGTTTNYIYIQDATGGIQLNSNSHGKTWASGKKLSGTIIGTYQNNSTSAYMPRVNVSDFGTTDVTSAAAALPTPVDITKGSESNICKLVRLQNVKFQSTALSSNTVYVQKSDLDIDTVYNTFGVLNQTLPNSATLCDVTGVLIKYSQKYEIAPVSVDGITTHGALAILPTFSPAGSTDSENPLAVAVGKVISVTPASGMTSTLKDGDAEAAALPSETNVTINSDKAIVVTASAYYYTDNTATYYYHSDPSLTEWAISKASMSNGTVTIKNGDDEVSSAVSSSVITLEPHPTYTTNSHYHFVSWDVYKTGETSTKITVTNNQFTMPAYAVTVGAEFAEDAKYAISFDGNGNTGGTAPSAIANKYEGVEITLPSCNYKKSGYSFTHWVVTETVSGDAVAVANNKFNMPAAAVTITAQWEELPEWATIYTSNITTTANSLVEAEDEEEYDAWKVNSGSFITLDIPKGTTAIHMHLVAWNKEAADATISGTCFSVNKVVSLTADAGISGSSPFSLDDNEGSEYYFSFTPDNAINANTTITITAATNKRLVIFGVNAIFPEITLSPASYDFENVRANQTKEQEFTIAKNANVIGSLSASIIDDANGKYSIGDIVDGKVTVTFAPGEAESGTFTAKLKVEATNASVTANLTGTAIAALAPEITVDKDAVAFGRVDPNASVSEDIQIGLLNIEGAVNAALSGDDAGKFALSAESFTEDGVLRITPTTSAQGVFSATLTLSAAGAESKVIPISMIVASKWATMYTSNVTDLSSNENKKVKVGTSDTEYNAVKANAGATATFKVPKGTQKIHLHLVAWSGEAANVTITGSGCFTSSKVVAITANSDISGTSWSPLTLTEAQAISYYKEIALDVIPSAVTTITATATSGKRFVLFGVNQEGGLIEITEDTDVSTLPSNINVEVKDGATITVDAEKSLDNLTVRNGGSVNLSSDKLTVVGQFTIESTMASGKSGQLNGALPNNFEAGEAYIDITLGVDISVNSNKAANQWHAFTVPFPVHATEGIYNAATGTKLTNEVDYAIMDYHGDVRANGLYGWKKFRGVMTPGTFYLMTVNGDIQTFRMKKTVDGALVSADSKSYTAFSGSGESTDQGWNGVGNPTLKYAKVGYNVQVLDPESYTYVLKTANSANFVVGTPFFYQAETNGSMAMLDANAGANYAPVRRIGNSIENIDVQFGNDNFTDHLYLSADEEALNEYQVGKDLVKMSMTKTPSVAQIFGNAYGSKLCMMYMPLVNGFATFPLSLYAPTAGEYNLHVGNIENDIYLLENDVIIWNLRTSDYSIDLNKGTNESYSLILQPRSNTPTDVEEITTHHSGVEKLLINDHIYILRNGKMYDMTGKITK